MMKAESESKMTQEGDGKRQKGGHGDKQPQVWLQHKGSSLQAAVAEASQEQGALGWWCQPCLSMNPNYMEKQFQGSYR